MARILVIEDNTVLRALVRGLLESQGYSVVEAANGAEGLQVYAAAPADLVITDLEMPVLDGFQVLRALRHTAPAAAVLAISGDPHALVQARTLTPYTLAKPLALQPLLATVQRLVAAPTPVPTSVGQGSDL
jgi:two-component system capsular synthesis sensor histidine kinase RcsC